jgi:hypothetical protein
MGVGTWVRGARGASFAGRGAPTPGDAKILPSPSRGRGGREGEPAAKIQTTAYEFRFAPAMTEDFLRQHPFFSAPPSPSPQPSPARGEGESRVSPGMGVRGRGDMDVGTWSAGRRVSPGVEPPRPATRRFSPPPTRGRGRDNFILFHMKTVKPDKPIVLFYSRKTSQA